LDVGPAAESASVTLRAAIPIFGIWEQTRLSEQI